MESALRMWAAWGKAVLAILAGIATVAGVATVWGIYPVGLIVLLVAGLLGALWIALANHQRENTAASGRGDPLAAAHDAAIVAEIRQVLTRERVEWLRGWDFGGSWRDDWVRPLRELSYLDDVEHRVFDPDLADALRQLFAANDAFTLMLAEHSFPEHALSDERWRNIGWSGGEAEGVRGEERRLWETRRSLLNDGADPVVDAYDQLMDVARRKHLLDRASPAQL